MTCVEILYTALILVILCIEEFYSTDSVLPKFNYSSFCSKMGFSMRFTWMSLGCRVLWRRSGRHYRIITSARLSPKTTLSPHYHMIYHQSPRTKCTNGKKAFAPCRTPRQPRQRIPDVISRPVLRQITVHSSSE